MSASVGTDTLGTLNFEQASRLVQDRLREALQALPADAEVINAAIDRLLATRPDELAMLALPFLIAEIEGMGPHNAVPIAAAHRLWWTAAHVFDDVIDGGDLTYAESLGPGEAVMASVVCASTLPLKICC